MVGADITSVGAGAGGSPPLPNHDTLGYEWFAVVYRPESGVQDVGHGVCFGSDQDVDKTGAISSMSKKATREGILDAWTWKSYEVALSKMLNNDVVAVYARLVKFFLCLFVGVCMAVNEKNVCLELPIKIASQTLLLIVYIVSVVSF